MLALRYYGFCLSLFLIFTSGIVLAERPTAPKLLPERSLVVVRIRNVPDTIKKFKATALGRVLQDEQVGPLVSKLYTSGQEAYSKIEEQVGVPLERILAIPQGEAWFAVVPSTTGGTPALALLMDTKDQLPTVLKLLERGGKLFEENGGKITQETIQEARVNVYTPAGNESPKIETRKNDDGVQVEVKVAAPGTFVQFEKDGSIVLATSLELAEELLKNWSASEVKSLTSNERFASIMRRCSTGKDEPEFEWYVDPLTLAKHALRGNITAQTTLTILPAIGLDGIQAVGGTVTYGTGEFDETHHLHLLLENPRSGVLDLLALTPSDATPEPWVPGNVVSYITFHWDLRKTYEGGAKLYDSFLGEGKAREEIKNRVGNALGLDFETELLPALDGRVTLAQWMEPPARLNSQCNLLGVKLVDAKAFSGTFDKLVTKFTERLEKKSFGTTTYYKITPREDRGIPPEMAARLRRPEPAMAIVGDYFLISDSVKCLENALTTISTGKNLANELDFKLIAAKIGRQAGGTKPGAIVFARPEETMRNLYELATGDDAKEQLSKQAESNEFFKQLNGAMKEHPLPPFAVIAKYLAPSGGVITQDETGFHYEAFSLKRK